MNIFLWAILWLVAIPLALALGVVLLVLSSRIPAVIGRLLGAALLLALAASAGWYGWTWADHLQGPFGGLVLLLSAITALGLLVAAISALRSR